MNDLDGKVRAAWADKSLTGKESFVSSGKVFLEKFGGCKGQDQFVTWLKLKVPETETALPDLRKKALQAPLIKRFNDGLKAKNWDDVYASGKELVAQWPDDFRPVEIDLASIGGEEGLASNNFKYADDSIRFAKQSLADLEGGKTFDKYGFSVYAFKDKTQAIGWLNLYVGFLTAGAKKDTAGALPYLYKASQSPASSDPKLPSSSTRPVVYELVGDYYYGELAKLVEQIKTKIADQKDSDTPEVAKQKADEIKGLVALSLGYSERVMDAYGRASANTTDAKIKSRLKPKIDNAYKVRFGKDSGSDAWVASSITKPFVNPQTPVAPIVESDQAVGPSGAGATTTSTGTASGTSTAKPVATPVSNPAAPAKPAAAPAKPASKPQASVKKPAKKTV